MATQREATDERQTRLDTLIEEFRAAEKRKWLRRGIALWTLTEPEPPTALPAEKMN